MAITLSAYFFTAPSGNSTSFTSVFSAVFLSNTPTILPWSSIDHQMTFSNWRCSYPWYSKKYDLINKYVMDCWSTGLPVASMESALERKLDPWCSSSSGKSSRVWGFSSGASLCGVIELTSFSCIAASNADRFWASYYLDGANSLGRRRKSDQHGNTFPFIYRMAWHILLP